MLTWGTEASGELFGRAGGLTLCGEGLGRAERCGLSDGGLPRPLCWLGSQVETDSGALGQGDGPAGEFGAAQADGSRAGQVGHDGGLVGGELRRQKPKVTSTSVSGFGSSVQPCAARTSDCPGHVGGRQRAVLGGAASR